MRKCCKTFPQTNCLIVTWIINTTCEESFYEDAGLTGGGFGENPVML
jgi:hypothetical protein